MRNRGDTVAVLVLALMATDSAASAAGSMLPDDGDRHRLTTLSGLAALSLDALSRHGQCGDLPAAFPAHHVGITPRSDPGGREQPALAGHGWWIGEGR